MLTQQSLKKTQLFLFRSCELKIHFFFMIKSNGFDKDFANNRNKLHLNTNKKL